MGEGWGKLGGGTALIDRRVQYIHTYLATECMPLHAFVFPYIVILL